MMIAKHFWSLFFYIPVIFFLFSPDLSLAESPSKSLTLKETIELALKANLKLKRSQEEVKAAQATKKARRADFLPTLSASYDYLHRNRILTQELFGVSNIEFVLRPQDEYTFVTSFTQPIFNGFSLINQYKIASLGLDVAEITTKLTRQDVILDAKNAYYSVLKSQKLLEVARQTVTQIAAQKEVAENFYEVGMSPLNDLLQAQVELANAKQRLIVEQNNVEIAKAQFNTVLRNPINAPVAIGDILDYTPFEHDISYCLSKAGKNRLEIQVADLEVEIADKEVKLAQKNYYPSVNLRGEYIKIGDDPNVDGGEGITDAASWNIRATASWDFWEWGRTNYGIKEKLSRLSQAQLRKSEILDNIHLEVKQAYLRTKEAEKNIITVEKAIEQAKENYRINLERYKEQVATSTEVLDAQILQTRTMTNYFNALYDFKISKATLYRAMGQEVLE